MRIFYKLIACFLFVALLSAAVAYIGITVTNNIDQAHKSVSEETIPVTEALENLRYLGIKINLYTHELIFKTESKDVAEGPEEILGKLNGTFKQYNITIIKLDELVDKFFPDKRESTDNIKMLGEKYIGLTNELIILKNSNVSAEYLNKTYYEFEIADKKFQDAVDIALEMEVEEFQERTNNLEFTIAWSKNFILIVSLLSFIMAMVIGAAISISISGPITKLKDATEDIRRGKLDTAVEISSDDETGVLADAFNKMVSDLAQEIKEHKQTAANLREKNDFVKTVLEALPHPFYVINVKDYTVTLANSAACAKGFADDMTCYALTHKTDKPCGTEGHLCPLEEVKRTGKPAMTEHLHYDNDGNVRNMEVHCYPIFDLNGNVVQAIEYSLEITERKRAQEALAESEERYRSIIEHSSDIVWSQDINGNFTFINKQAENITGYPVIDFIGKSIVSLLNRDDIPRIKEIFQKTLGGKLQQYEITIKSNDGSDLTLSVNSTPYFSKGKISGAVSFARDITELKKAQEVQRENERLALANRAKTEFLTVMSHELRTPLNAIIGFSDLLKKKNAGELNEKQQRYAENVYSSGKHLLSLIDDILDITRVESGKMETIIDKVSVPKIINESADLIKEKAAKQNIRIITQVSPDIEFIETDEKRFRQILNNLIDNAVKFSKQEGGTVTITAAKERDMVKFSVSDTGIGIKKEDIGRMFRSFEQLDAGITRKYGGTGLGLAVSKKLVELLGGRIKAESIYGDGSRFTFYLPATAEKERG